ncbi:zinc finger, AN1-type domain [Dissophora globulifera]|nr:zinc finger, AN1-type domain [Dissophora globulifera]
MEFPSIGKHCSDHSCSQLDFLPYTCQYCSQIFCQDHWRLETHQCPNKNDAVLKDQRVPVCPLCDKPVPIKKGEDPNLRMEQHIAAGCPEPASTVSKPIYTNSCNAKGCKNRSAIPVVCQKCRLNYCLKHRLEGDHACSSIASKPSAAAKGKGGSGAGAAAAAAAAARVNGNTRNTKVTAPAQSRATATSNGGNRSSTGKDKDKCLIS